MLDFCNLLTSNSSGNSTQMQLSMMDEFMNNHKELARGSFIKSENGKEKCNKLWIELKTKLNAIGPPTRTVNEWKRVSYIQICVCTFILDYDSFFYSVGLDHTEI